MAISGDLADSLRLDLINQDELEVVLEDVFPNADMRSGTTTWSHKRTDGSTAIDVTYEDDALTTVEDRSLTPAERIALGDAADRVLQDCGDIVATSLAFARRPVEGFWRHRDNIQILPVPQSAPRPPQFFAEHPLLLQVAVGVSAHPGVNRLRITRRSDDVRSLLGVALRDPLFGIGDGSSHCWVVDTASPDRPPQFRQTGYYLDLSGYSAVGFRDTGAVQPAEAIDTVPYYSRVAVGSLGPLAVPVGLGSYFEAFDALNAQQRDRFLNACHWYLESWSPGAGHTSRDFICLVTAIEALVPEQKPGPPCPECHRPTTPGPSRAFKSFLESYAPTSSSRDRTELYRQRSKLTHGQVHNHDLHTRVTSLRPDRWSDFIRSDYARGVVRTAIMNWLCEAGSLPAELRLTAPESGFSTAIRRGVSL